VTWGVEHVDGGPVERERHHRSLDRDAAAPFQSQRVRLGSAGVDRSRFVDHPSQVQKSLGEGGLTSVDVGKNAQIEQTRVHA
jgi:hypothetical protein